MKKLKTIKIFDGLMVSLYVWDCKDQKEVKRLKKKFPQFSKFKNLDAFREKHGGFTMTTEKDWIIAINKTGEYDPIYNALPHELNHLSDILASSSSEGILESSEFRSSLVGDLNEEFAKALIKELQG